MSKKILFIFILIMIMVMLSCRIMEKKEAPLTKPSRTEIKRTIELNEKWRLSGIVIDNLGDFVGVSANTHYLAISNRSQTDLLKNISLYDAESGEHLWKTKNMRAINSMIVTDDSLYIATDKKIEKYEIDGEFLGSTQTIASHRIYSMQLLEDTVSIFWTEDFFDKRIQMVGKISGDIENFRYEEQFVLPNTRLLTQTLNDNYWTDQKMFWKTSGTDQKIIWSVVLPDIIEFYNIEDNKIALTLSGGYPYTITAFNTEAGSILYKKTSSATSNVGVSSDRFYYLDTDQNLVGFSLEDGIEIGRIQYSDILNDSASKKFIYLLKAFHNDVYVYFGDNYECIKYSYEK